MNDEKIIKKAKEFNLKVASKRIYENEVDSYNYIIFRKGTLRKTSPRHYVREITIIYAFDGEQKISDFEIIEAFEELGVTFNRMEPDDFQAGQTNKWIDINTYIFERPERNY